MEYVRTCEVGGEDEMIGYKMGFSVSERSHVIIRDKISLCNKEAMTTWQRTTNKLF